MRTVTWKPGTNQELDQLFDECREIQFNDDHHLSKNYSRDFYDFSIALTIAFDENNKPEICSSIASRDCWPVGVYRILNRLWKHSNKVKFPRKMSPSFGRSAASQIQWLAENTNSQLYFISRQTENWEEWCMNNFQELYNLPFQTDNYKYLTCPNESDETCWQKIIYNGNKKLLEQWKRRQHYRS